MPEEGEPLDPEILSGAVLERGGDRKCGEETSVGCIPDRDFDMGVEVQGFFPRETSIAIF